MNIKLTLTEATELIRVALKVPKHQDLTVQIIVVSHPYAVALHETKRMFPRYYAEQKISAIKHLRETGGRTAADVHGQTSPLIGLADAKWAIENYDAALDNLNKYGKLRL
jgi:hypothetical protein